LPQKEGAVNIIARLIWGKKPEPAPIRKGLCCVNCQQNIHKGEHYKVLSARHRDCSNPNPQGPRTLLDQLEEGL
jgi:hypothetical protein